MRQFTDSNGIMHAIAINVAAVKRVRGMVGLDLAGLINDGAKPLAELLGDPVKFVDVLHVLCDCEKRDISPDAFAEALGGDSLEAAADAFLAELVDFFPNRGARDALRSLIAKAGEARTEMLAQATAAIERIDPGKLSMPGGSAGGSRASSESIPAPSPSAS